MKPVVFYDFDGTITVEETFVAMLKQFTPEVTAEIIPQLYDRTITLREGVKIMLESIPYHRYSEIIEFYRPQPIRPGLVELIDFLDSRNIPFLVVSGGIRLMVEMVLGTLVNRVAGMYAVDINATGNYWKVQSEFVRGWRSLAVFCSVPLGVSRNRINCKS
ncbi:MAG: HAD-IB family phosphatase [Microcoleaceae cyanobacterium]